MEQKTFLSSYCPESIELKWQKFWEEKKLFEVKKNEIKPKYYVLDMLPYPSSAGLHVGHPEGYTATDIVSRYKRARGFNVLHPMGWDAFGLPAEQFALQTGVHPEVTTSQAIHNFRRQLKRLGFSYDWSREISTCNPNYYKWTQFIFSKLYELGLAYQTEVPVNWCPVLKTVLANEEVVNGVSERGGHPVFRVPMKQWMLKITNYAERLLQGLDALDWPESTKELQRNWIGKSEGVEVFFCTVNKENISVFTTRVDTLFGVTFLVLAPEHPLISSLVSVEQRLLVEEYCKTSSRKSEIERQNTVGEKTGVFSGVFAIHPCTQQPLPIWVSDYVLMNYGTGAVMGVPSHDDRDADFAKKMNLPFKTVLSDDQTALVNSDFLNNLSCEEGKKIATAWLEQRNSGKRVTCYKLRDWLFSRQRYWGEPIPIVHAADGTKKLIPLDELPITLPEISSYEPTGTGESPLAAVVDWVQVHFEGIEEFLRRETDTMPGSAGSSWYFFRYCDPHNSKMFIDPEIEKYWMPVDLYVGGAEHAVGHLLYARFWTKVLYDLGFVSCEEPFLKLVHQGMILGEDGEKMSKSKGNVVNPDVVVERYGADTLRVYEMFMGPLEKEKPWSTEAIEGVYRFLQRSWRLYFDPSAQIVDVVPSPADLKITHKTIKKVTQDIEQLRLNTAISQMMIFVNAMIPLQQRPKSCLRSFAQLLHPFAPHLAEEVWEKLGEKTLLSFTPWPDFDPELTKDSLVIVVIQVMGKRKGSLEIPPGTTQSEVEALALQLPAIARALKGRSIAKVIFVPDKILNFVYFS